MHSRLITYHWRYVPVYPEDAVHEQHHFVWGIKERAEGVRSYAYYRNPRALSSSTNDRGLQRAVRLFPIRTDTVLSASLRWALMLIYLPSLTCYEIVAERAAAALSINYLTHTTRRIARTDTPFPRRCYVVDSSSVRATVANYCNYLLP